MAVSIQPVDGLIHRLLQQNSKPSTISESGQAAGKPHDDRVTLSKGAQDSSVATQVQEQPQQKPGERALESHLLNLYRANDRLGG